MSKPVIGLAGGIGAGKSTVARLFEELGAAVIDSDRLHHEQLADPDVRAVLRCWWGDGVFAPSGEVDRRRLAAIVFNDPEALARLEGLTYPRIDRRRAELLEELERDPRARVVVLDSPKLIEAGVDRMCDAVVFVEADRATRLGRVAERRGWDDAELARRERWQAPLEHKRARADYVVVNHSTIDELRREVERVLNSVLAKHTAPAD